MSFNRKGGKGARGRGGWSVKQKIQTETSHDFSGEKKRKKKSKLATSWCSFGWRWKLNKKTLRGRIIATESATEAEKGRGGGRGCRNP